MLIVALSMRPSLVELGVNGLLRRLPAIRGDALSADFARLFRSTLPRLTRLLLCYNQHAGTCIAPQLALAAARGTASLALTELSLSHSSFRGDGESIGESIARVVDAAPRLARLDLTSVQLNRLDLVLEAAARHGALRVLDLNDCVDANNRTPSLESSLVALLRATRTLEVLRCAGVAQQPAQLLDAICDAPSLHTADIGAVFINNTLTRPPSITASFTRLLERNATLHVLRCPDAITDAVLDVWEERNFALYQTNSPLVTHDDAQLERLRRVQSRNRRIHEWVAMRERVLEVAVAMGELRLPPYVLEQVIDSIDNCMHMTRHWNKIRVLIAVQKYQNSKEKVSQKV
jgi:hypothetical protein